MSRRMRRMPASFAVTVMLLAFAPGLVAAQELEQALDRVASAWHRGDASAITALAARGGIALDVDRSSVGPVGPRQAAAVLRRIFDERQSASTRTSMAREIGGSPARAFGEITWSARAPGTTIPDRATVFVAFVREDDHWRITEIRLLR